MASIAYWAAQYRLISYVTTLFIVLQVERMLDIQNKTPFSTTLIPGLDKHGHSFAVVIIKGTFAVHDRAPVLVIAEEQQPILPTDIFYGDPNKTSVKYEADIAPIKTSLDVVLVGHAYAPSARPVSIVDTSLQVGVHKKIIRVFGDRFWERDNLRWQASKAQPFERTALTYENAFGGAVPATAENEAVEFCTFNPIGKGFVGRNGQGLIEGLPLPNLENPADLIENWNDQPAPVGFGFIGRSWQPRLDYAGTYDLDWREKRMPLLPLDFNEKYYSGAHPDLQLANQPLDGEEVVATNLSESGMVRFSLPRYKFTASANIKGKSTTYQAVMDTIIIEPDDQRVQLTWRVAIPCARQFLHIEKITIDWRSV